MRTHVLAPKVITTSQSVCDHKTEKFFTTDARLHTTSQMSGARGTLTKLRETTTRATFTPTLPETKSYAVQGGQTALGDAHASVLNTANNTLDVPTAQALVQSLTPTSGDHRCTIGEGERCKADQKHCLARSEKRSATRFTVPHVQILFATSSISVSHHQLASSSLFVRIVRSANLAALMAPCKISVQAASTISSAMSCVHPKC